MKIRVEFSNETIKEKLHKWRVKVKTFLRKLAAAALKLTAKAIENADKVAPAAAIIIPAAVKMYRIIVRQRIYRDQIKRKERYIYDPSLRYRVKLKRKLRPHEINEFMWRRKRGDRVFDILSGMGVA